MSYTLLMFREALLWRDDVTSLLLEMARTTHSHLILHMFISSYFTTATRRACLGQPPRHFIYNDDAWGNRVVTRRIFKCHFRLRKHARYGIGRATRCHRWESSHRRAPRRLFSGIYPSRAWTKPRFSLFSCYKFHRIFAFIFAGAIGRKQWGALFRANFIFEMRDEENLAEIYHDEYTPPIIASRDMKLTTSRRQQRRRYINISIATYAELPASSFFLSIYKILHAFCFLPRAFDDIITYLKLLFHISLISAGLIIFLR